MPAAMGMVIKCITAIVIKLINKPNRQSSNDLYSQCREKINSCCGVCDAWSYNVSKRGYNYKQNWCNYQIASFQGFVIRKAKVQSLQSIKQRMNPAL